MSAASISCAYQPEALQITLTCLTSNPSGNDLCKLIRTAPILGNFICHPVTGLDLNWGNTNERYCPNFLNLGNPKPRSCRLLKDLESRLRASCNTWDCTSWSAGKSFLARECYPVPTFSKGVVVHAPALFHPSKHSRFLIEVWINSVRVSQTQHSYILTPSIFLLETSNKDLVTHFGSLPALYPDAHKRRFRGKIPPKSSRLSTGRSRDLRRIS